jgi:hypothetical protein
MLAFCVAQRHAQVTFNPPFHERLVVGKLELYPGRVMAQIPPNHVLARGADHVPLDVVGDPVPKPKRQRARPRPARELGDEGIARFDRCCQMADKGLKVRLPGVGSGPLDDRAQCGEFFARFAQRVVRGFRPRTPPACFFGRLMRFGHSHLPNGEGRDKSTPPKGRTGAPFR